jgi:hypothetical protein
MKSTYVAEMDRELARWVESMDRDPVVGGVIRGDASRDGYVRFLWSTYHYLRWSGTLLAETAKGLRRVGRYPWLVEVVDEKTAEESPHDAWLLEDLEQCGVDVERVKASAAPAAVRAYVEWGLTMAEGGSPGYLGAAYALEFISMRRAGVAARNLRAHEAIPHIEAAVSFLVGHGDADSGHVALLRGLLDKIEDPRDQEAIAVSAAVLRVLYSRFFHLRRNDAAVANDTHARTGPCDRSAV